MRLTLEQRVQRLEKQTKRSVRLLARVLAQHKPVEDAEKDAYITWQNERVEELRAQGMSRRQAKNRAWHEAQQIDFAKKM